MQQTFQYQLLVLLKLRCCVHYTKDQFDKFHTINWLPGTHSLLVKKNVGHYSL
jgi:hypothetical protein